MVLRSFDGVEPDVHESAHVDETAVVIGDVTLEADASVWPNAVLRGDRGGSSPLASLPPIESPAQRAFPTWQILSDPLSFNRDRSIFRRRATKMTVDGVRLTSSPITGARESREGTT